MNQNTDYIPFAKPCLGVEEERAVVEVLKSGWLTTGKVTREFEKAFAEFLGAGYARAVSSGTAGLHLCLEAVGVKEGTRVVTTPYTFTASAETIRYLGADPLFVDIEEDTYNIDPRLVERVLFERPAGISAVLPVHIAGLPCNMSLITEVSQRAGVPVVEDAAHAFPVRYGDRYAGTIGTAGVFSFYANKTITTGEGGMVATDDEEVAGRISIMRFHGIDRESWDRYTSPHASWYYNVVEAGFKYNLTDIASSIGLAQLKKAEIFLARRKKIAHRYIDALRGCDFFTLPAGSVDHAWHLFMIRIVPGKLTLTRDEFVRKLAEAGIGTSVHFIPLYLMSYYRLRYGLHESQFPVTQKNYLGSFSIPIYPDLSDEQVERIISALLATGKNAYKRNS
ncbi:MAG: DegT/DnrJ/EryC1/StrS family aminotransferase [Spirochaetales bacterium]|nr:DegT/DnrJ/EryC1/StrS family aminotransferase [Spirochaetales bacterium]